MAGPTVVIQGDISQLQRALKVLGTDFETLQKEVLKTTTGVNKAFDEATASMADFKAEIRRVEASFKNLSGKELQEAQIQVGKLRNAMVDQRAMMKAVGEDAIPVMVNGLRGLVAMAQGVTSSLQVFGVQSEKLEKSMVALINASMALNTAWELYEKQTLKATSSLIKDTAAKVANSVTTKVLAATTNGATIAQKALNVAMLAAPYVAIAAALGGIIYAITKLSDSAKEAEMIWNVWAKKTRELIESVKKSTQDYHNVVEAFNKKVQDFNDRNLTDGEKAKKQYLATAEANKQVLKTMLVQAQLKANLIQGEIEHAKAQYEWMRWLAPQQALIIANGIMELEARHKNLTDAVKTNAAIYKEWEANIESNAEKIRQTLDYIKANTSGDAVKTKAIIAEMNKLISIKTRWLELQVVDVNLEKRQEELISSRLEHLKIGALAELKNHKKTAEEQLNVWKRMYEQGELTAMEYYSNLARFADDYIGKVSEGVNNLAEIQSNLADAEKSKFEAYRKEETESIEEEYDKRLAAAGTNALQKKRVEEWYTNESAKLTESLDKQQEEMMKKQKRREQIVLASQATMDYATGVVKIWAENTAKVITIPQAVALTALLTGVYATQLSVIKSQKFAHGGQGVLGGQYHGEGGVMFGPGMEAEKDERWAIFSRSATRKNTGLPDLIDAINTERLVIDKELMTHMLHNGGRSTNVIVANFKGGEHLKGMHELMRQQANKKNVPGRVKLGITNRRYLN